MACRLFGAKPLPEPMLAYCQLDSREQISVKFGSEFFHFHSRKFIWKCRLPKTPPFCPKWNDLMPLTIQRQRRAYRRLVYNWTRIYSVCLYSLQWRHNYHDSVSNHQPHGCLLNRLFGRRSKKTSKLRVTGLCVGNSPGTGEFPA